MKKPKAYKLPKGKALMLRTCDSQMRAHGGFVWPRSGPVECPDWDPTGACGNGLHGLLWGVGDGGLLSWVEDAVALVVEVDAAAVVELGGKVKVPRGIVVYVGKIADAAAWLAPFAPVQGQVAITATAGDRGTATAGYLGTATAGDRGTATAGYRGTATAGYLGTATAGYRGTATAGDRGTATAGESGTATAGESGAISVLWWDGVANRYRRAVAEVDGVTIRPGVPYRVVDGKLVEADTAYIAELEAARKP